MRSIPVSEIEALLEGQIDVRRRPGAVQPLMREENAKARRTPRNAKKFFAKP